MPITQDSPFRSPSHISKAGFIKVLTDAKSPFAPNATVIYEMIEANDHDPAKWLGICKHEHQFGTDPKSVMVRNDTKSWLNARTIRDPRIKDAVIILDPVRNSRYVKYAKNIDSVQDGIYRIDDPTYAYKDAVSLIEVISILAPATDANKPNLYTADIVLNVNKWEKQYPPEEEPTMPDYKDQPLYIWKPSPSFGYPRGSHGRLNKPIDRIIIHTTEGSYDSALGWLTRTPTPPDEGSSTHYLVSKDGKRKSQLVLEADAAWTAGNREYNLRGINIEMEGKALEGNFSDGLYQEVAALSANIIRRYPNIQPTREFLIGHKDVPNQDHYDPGPHWDWNKYIALVKEKLNVPTETQRYFEETGHWLSGGFYQYWNRRGADDGLQEYGFPISEEFTDADTNVTVQYFERARLEFQPEIAGNEWGTIKGLVGNEIVALGKIAEKYPDAFARKPNTL